MTNKHQSNEPKEITSFNEELVSFDENDLDVAELERRFELAVGLFYLEASCGKLTCQSVFCDELSCGTYIVDP